MTNVDRKHELLFQFSDASISIRDRAILHDVSWSVKKGQHWIVTGGMGAGKTVLAKTILGTTRIASGNLSFPFLGLYPSYERRKKEIAFVSFSDTSRMFRSPNHVHYYQQRFNAFDSDHHLTVLDYLKLRPEHSHHDLFESLGITSLLPMERIKLSSGQIRRVLLAKALIRKPKILILDNAHIGLDDTARARLNTILDEMVSQGDTTLILLGQFREIPKCISQELHLDQGRVTYCNAVQSNRASSTNGIALPPDIPTLMRNMSVHPEADEIIKFKGVSISYDGNKILGPLHWKVHAGEKWSILGDNGSGKSSIFGLVYGDHPQAYGNPIWLYGRKRGSGESIWQIKEHMGFTSPELHAYFDLSLTARQLVSTGPGNALVPQKLNTKQETLFNLLCSYFDVEQYSGHLFDQLSTGTQRLFLFIRALIKCPSVFLMDEPFQGLDAVTIQKCKELFKIILTEKHTLAFISHFQDEIPEGVDRSLYL